jgi:hypothetical protein
LSGSLPEPTTSEPPLPVVRERPSPRTDR